MIGLEIFILVIFWMLFLGKPDFRSTETSLTPSSTGASATIAVQWPSSFYCSSYKSYW